MDVQLQNESITHQYHLMPRSCSQVNDECCSTTRTYLDLGIVTNGRRTIIEIRQEETPNSEITFVHRMATSIPKVYHQCHHR
jgi:hypothetical protein